MKAIEFGTDGVRGRAGTWPMLPEGARRLGRAVARWTGGGRVLVGRDTRESSPELAAAVIDGLVEGGAVALDAGVLPTAALSCAIAGRGDAGVMVTASHNPWHDNGFKVLGGGGAKLDEAQQAQLQALLADDPAPPGGGRASILTDPTRPWREAMPKVDLHGVRVLLDCAHGAAAPHAPGVLRELGASLLLRGCDPNGRNINEGVGALYPPTELAGADLAICLDGDADRVVLVDPTAGPLDGDDLLWLLSRRVEGPVVGTVMSNAGLEEALAGRLVRAPVGDRNVAAQMKRTGAQVGAEPSGHLLFASGLPTADGLYTALRVLAECGLPLPVRGWTRWPSASRTVRAGNTKPSLDALSSVQGARAAGHRVVARWSGTEPVARVLVEGTDCEAWADRIAREIGALGLG